jgi:penicillin V acylase-like amidase (Ntn superfamily)
MHVHITAIGPSGTLTPVCTRVLSNTNDLAVLTGRSRDWPESTEPLIVAFPPGRRRDGGAAAGETVVAENPLWWTSRYGSLVTTVYGIGAIDGINERAQRIYYFELTTSPNTIWIHLDGLDLTQGAQPLAIDPYDESLIGDVTSRFTPHQSAF